MGQRGGAEGWGGRVGQRGGAEAHRYVERVDIDPAQAIHAAV